MHRFWKSMGGAGTIYTYTSLLIIIISTFRSAHVAESYPIVINTWDFTNATANAWNVLASGGSALDAVEVGCTTCEKLQCDLTVGFGGSPDENGETTLDAMIMDAETHNIGAVGSLRGIRSAVSVARAVLEHTSHTLLVGELATDFARQMGFRETNLTTVVSRNMHEQWLQTHCQPNFWRNVEPDPRSHCGPYSRRTFRRNSAQHNDDTSHANNWATRQNHDTIGMLAIDARARIAAATSTNGAKHKIPGRVGDSPIPGAGSYASRSVGAAAATGDGDVMMRFLPSLLTVEHMRSGASPTEASRQAVRRIVNEWPDFSGAVVALSADGRHGAACHGLPEFPYSVGSAENHCASVRVIRVPCM